MSSRDRPRDDDLEERLDELEDVLAELRRDLTRDERYRTGPPRPPRLSELLRFTERYTIPTLIAVLETTIKSLELLRGTLRLADPGRGLDVDADASATTDRLAGVRDEASAGLARSLSELRTALSEADLPEETTSRSLIQDARDLTAEIEARIEESSRDADAARRRVEGSPDPRGDRSDDAAGRGSRDGSRTRSDSGDGSRTRSDSGDGSRTRSASDDGRSGDVVHIDVSDPTDDAADDSADRDPHEESHGTGADDDPTPEVDVESELESIKRQLDEPDAPGAEAGTDGDGGDSDGPDTERGGSDADGNGPNTGESRPDADRDDTGDER